MHTMGVAINFAGSSTSFMVTLSGSDASPFFSRPIASKIYFVSIVFKVILLLTETTQCLCSQDMFWHAVLKIVQMCSSTLE